LYQIITKNRPAQPTADKQGYDGRKISMRLIARQFKSDFQSGKAFSGYIFHG
jgi:hypothetical protein